MLCIFPPLKLDNIKFTKPHVVVVSSFFFFFYSIELCFFDLIYTYNHM